MSEKSSRGRNLTEARFYVHKYLLKRLFGEVAADGRLSMGLMGFSQTGPNGGGGSTHITIEGRDQIVDAAKLVRLGAIFYLTGGQHRVNLHLRKQMPKRTTLVESTNYK